MTIAEATEMIQTAPIDRTKSNRWADLGCGEGIFTYALASLLPERSTLYAIDREQQRMSSVNERVEVIFERADFESGHLPVGLDGILMANSLHYVADQLGLINRLKQHLHSSGRFIIIEYDSMRSNPWVPYPIDLIHLQKLFHSEGFDRMTRLSTRRSMYGNGDLYACLLERTAIR